MGNDMFDKPVKHESFGVVEVSRVSALLVPPKATL